MIINRDDLMRKEFIGEMSPYMKKLCEENYQAIEELSNSLYETCKLYEVVNENSDIRILNESVKDSILKYMEKVSLNASKAWENFKKDADQAKIDEVINKENLPYFASGFKMQFPQNFNMPRFDQWKLLRDQCKILVLDQASFNGAKQYLEDPDKFMQQYYRSFYIHEQDFIDTCTEKCLPKTGGVEVISTREIEQYVSFLKNYKDQMDAISRDIDDINRSSNNIKNMINQLPANECSILAFETRDYLIELVNEFNKFRDAEAKPREKSLSPQQQKRQESKQIKSDRKLLNNYYMATMDVLSVKMRICSRIKNQSLKVLKQYIKLQPKELKNSVNVEIQKTDKVNTNADVQIKK